MTFNNRNINFFCTITESDKARILKGGFWAIKMYDANTCFLRSNLILCIRLSKSLQAYTSKQGDFKYKQLNRSKTNFADNSTNFNFLSAECNKCDFGLIEYEC